MKINRLFRRIMTGMLCAAMLVTAVPGTVFAEQLPVNDEVDTFEMLGETDAPEDPVLTGDDTDEEDPESLETLENPGLSAGKSGGGGRAQ